MPTNYCLPCHLERQHSIFINDDCICSPTYEKYQRKPSVMDIITAFKDEIPGIANSKAQEWRHDTKEFDDIIKKISNSPRTTQEKKLDMLILSGFIDTSPKARMAYDAKERMKQLKTIIKNQKENNGNHLTEEQTNRAKQVPIPSLYDFQKISRNGKALCPFHDENTPSFTIFKNNTFYCFGCQANGDAIDFYMKIKGVSFPQSVRALIG